MILLPTNLNMNSKASLALSDFALSVTSATTDKEIYATLATNLPIIIESDRSSVTLLTEDQLKLEVFALCGSDGALPIGKFFPVENTLIAVSLFSNKLNHTIITQQHTEYDAQQLLAQGIKTCINSPIVFGERAIGTINIGSFQADAYNDDTLKLFSLITDLVSTYLERQHLLKQAQIGVKQYKTYSKQLEQLNHITELFSSAMSAGDVLTIIQACSTLIIDAQCVTYSTYDAQKNSCNIQRVIVKKHITLPESIPANNSYFNHISKIGEPDYCEDISNSPFVEHQLLAKQGLISSWSVPVRINGQIIGLLNAATDTQIEDSQQQLNLLKMLSGNMSATLTRIQLQGQIEYNANYDTLTTLPNRHQFNHAVTQATRLYDSKFSLLFIDLDRFKLVNDTLGHDIGDELLCLVTRRLKEQVRESDFVARHGGDEFIILLQNCGSEKIAQRVSLKIVNAIKQPFYIKEHTIFIGASIGISRFPADSKKPDELIKFADIAMYSAKHHGRSTYEIYSDKLLEKIHHKQKLDSLLRLAIDNKQLSLKFQPIIKNKRVTSFEALIRWQHPELGNISPEVFIPIAEESLLIEELTEWVIMRSLETIKRVRDKYQDIYVSVNISAKDCNNINKLKSLVFNALSLNELSGSALQLEITENTFLNDIEKVEALISDFKNHGISFAIDDFGTGYSSLTYLLKLPIDVLKIDMEFIKDMQYNQTKLGVVKGIVDITKILSISCIAEGVETQEQANSLKKLGCTRMQGYLFSKPISEDDLLTFIVNNNIKNKKQLI